TPTKYRVYFSDGRDVFHPFANPGGGTFARYQDFDPADVPEVLAPPGLGPGAEPKRFVLVDSVSWGSDYRAIAIDGSVSVSAGRGVVPSLYVGDETYGGITRSTFLIAYGAVKEIEGAYIGGVRQAAVGRSTAREVPCLA